MQARIIEVIDVGERQIRFNKKMAKSMKRLKALRKQGTPDRFREEDLLQELNQNKVATEIFWKQGGYKWVG